MWKWIEAAALKEQVVDRIGEESIGVREHFEIGVREHFEIGVREHFEKYGAEGMIASSVGLGWSGLSAALCTHGRGMTKYHGADSEAGIFVAICPSNSLVTRLTDGVVDRRIAERGTIWLKPPGPREVLVDIAAPVPQILHMYLPARHFSAESLGVDIDHAAHGSLRYQHSFQDPLISEIAFAIVSEMRTQTAGGRLLAEALAVSLAARLVHSHSGLAPDKDLEQLSHEGLDRRRLTRVREYIDANLEGGSLTIARLAKVASLSQFHFARAFKAAVGKSPHQYVSEHRLERAKMHMRRGDQSLLDIAIALNFSSQANFTRAFRKGTGMTPGQYRRSFARH
jgi:AraC family transcriptional regulator